MKYIKEDLEKMLREHLKNEAKLKEIKLKKEEYEERLKYAGTVNEETAEEIIEGMQLSGQAYDIIHSNTNKITDKTATVAMNYHREEQYINQEDRAYLERKISECEEETNRLEKIVKRVNNLLEQATEDEMFVVKAYYMRKCKWDYIEKEYFNEFEKHKSIKQLQTYRDVALANMLDIINIGL